MELAELLGYLSVRHARGARPARGSRRRQEACPGAREAILSARERRADQRRLPAAVEMVSGKYALVETGRHFVLVPWRALIEKELGRQVTGLIRGDGISWELGRQRGLGI